MDNYCSIISIIPQYLGTCWFNAIHMSCLYSDCASRIFRDKSENPIKLAIFNIISYRLNYFLNYEKNN